MANAQTLVTLTLLIHLGLAGFDMEKVYKEFNTKFIDGDGTGKYSYYDMKLVDKGKDLFPDMFFTG